MKLFICVVLLVVGSLSAEHEHGAPSEAHEHGAPSEAQKQFDEANRQFNSKMFQEVAKQNQGKSVVLSAFTVLPPLAQLSLASVGESHDEILKTIGIPNDDVTKAVFTTLDSKLKSIKGVVIKMANKIYLANNYELNDEFSKLSKDVFGSEVKSVDFTKSEKAAKEMNDWVEEQTNHRIKDLVDPSSLDENTRTVLVNAMYFKGLWKDKFVERSTTDRDFYVDEKTVKKVPTMYQKSSFKYAKNEELGAQLLEMPYEDTAFTFLAVLPLERNGLPALLEKLKDPSVLDKAVAQMAETEVQVFLPKFKIETKTNLKDVLVNIGLKKIFGPNSGLEKLLKTNEPLIISEAIQKAFIEVNEEGAEAAAANEFQVAYLSAVIEPPSPVFDANHPFVFAVKQESRTLFDGIYQS